MTARKLCLKKQFNQKYQTKFQNLLVSGCSFTWNNSMEDLCTWPYYLRDIAGFDQVFDCSQSGAGSNHIFNSIINEIETNSSITAQDTLVIIMWSGLTRTDVISTQDITRPWHSVSNYDFDEKFATLSIFNHISGNSPMERLCQQYKRLVDMDAQIYESLLKIISLHAYLAHKGFNSVFANWKDPREDFDRIQSPLIERVSLLLDPVEDIGNYSTRLNLKFPNGHPTPDGHLGWTRECLIPYLEKQNFVWVL